MSVTQVYTHFLLVYRTWHPMQCFRAMDLTRSQLEVLKEMLGTQGGDAWIDLHYKDDKMLTAKNLIWRWTYKYADTPKELSES